VAYARDPLAFFTNTARQYGDIVNVRFLQLRTCLIHHPALIEEVLTAKHRSLTKTRDLRELRGALGDGLLTSEGDRWRAQRKLVQPAFHQDRIRSYAEHMVARAERMLAGWKSGERRDIHAELTRLTLDIVASVLFGVDVGRRSAESPQSTIGPFLEAMLRQWSLRVNTSFLLPAWFPVGANVRARRAVKRADAWIHNLIRQRRSEKRSTPRDLLDVLIAGDGGGDRAPSDREIRDQCMTLFLAGHETTAVALSWAFLLLSRHPRVAVELASELQRVLGKRAPTVSDLPELRVTRNVVRESMRLFPPAWAIGREAAEDIEIGGYEIQRGTQIYMSQWVVHRDWRFFADPDVFHPERWSDAFDRALPRFAYFPFGGGPRVCLGVGFAMTEAILVLATIAQRFHLEVLDSPPVRPWPSVTLRPENGMRAIIVPR
jgi:cytochrome P450